MFACQFISPGGKVLFISSLPFASISFLPSPSLFLSLSPVQTQTAHAHRYSLLQDRLFLCDPDLCPVKSTYKKRDGTRHARSKHVLGIKTWSGCLKKKFLFQTVRRFKTNIDDRTSRSIPQAFTHTLSHTPAHRALVHIHTHTFGHTHSHIESLTLTHAHTVHWHTCTFAQTHSHTLIHTDTHSHIQSTHTHTLAKTLAYTHTHTTNFSG